MNSKILGRHAALRKILEKDGKPRKRRFAALKRYAPGAAYAVAGIAILAILWIGSRDPTIAVGHTPILPPVQRWMPDNSLMLRPISPTNPVVVLLALVASIYLVFADRRQKTDKDR